MASNNPPNGFVRMNCNIEKSLHKELKQTAVTLEISLTDLVRKLIKEELHTMVKKGIK